MCLKIYMWKLWWANLKERDSMDDLGVGGRIILKLKLKWSRYRPGVAQKVGRGIPLLLNDRGTRRGWVVSSTPRPHFTPGKDPVPILEEAGWNLGPVWTDGKSHPHRDSILHRPARSQSLYRLNYPVLTRMILKRIVNNEDGRRWVDFSGSEQGKKRGFSEHGNKFSGSINCGKFFDWLKSHSFLRRTRF